ncbi:MAG TPA: hypothetical protein VIK89_09950 [Cytophagaceae bacterium]
MNELKDDEFDQKWKQVELKFIRLTGKKPNLNTILFLIGVQEVGKGKRQYKKEEKQDLMHVAICKLLSLSGFYELEGYDEEGWPHYKLLKPLPHFDLLEQEKLLKMHIIEYFSEELE